MMVTGIALLAAGILLGLTGFVIYLVAGFKVHVGWGLTMLLLPGLPQILFTIMHWVRARGAFLVSLAALLLHLGGGWTMIRSMPLQDWMNWLEMQGGEMLFDAGEWSDGEYPPPDADAERESPEPPERPMTAEDPESMLGRTLDEVRSIHGPPRGRLQTARNTIYHYTDWEFEADAQGRIVRVARRKR